MSFAPAATLGTNARLPLHQASVGGARLADLELAYISIPAAQSLLNPYVSDAARAVSA